MSTKEKNNKFKVAIRYGVTVPERALMDLLRLDCAGKIFEFRQGLDKLKPTAVFSKMKSLKEVFAIASGVLGIIQDAWKDALKEYADKTKLPVGTCPPGCKPGKPTKTKASLTEIEKRKIRALRKQGLTIKAIGKEIHRAEKVVADFVRTLTKK